MFVGMNVFCHVKELSADSCLKNTPYLTLTLMTRYYVILIPDCGIDYNYLMLKVEINSESNL